MERFIVMVNATQVVVSESHPEGLFSIMPNFPKVFDSYNYGGDVERTLGAAKVAYYDQLSKNYGYTNRAMTTVTLEITDGRQLLSECVGDFPKLPTDTEQPEE